jgi:predicted RND superfamily exporter protein
MDYLASFIVKNKKFMLILYGVLIVISLLLMSLVVVNYDLSSYLPAKLNSIIGKNILEDEFGITGIAYGLINDFDFKEVDIIVNDIENLPGVKNVIWMGSAEDILKPEDFFKEDIKNEFISGNSNLLQIHFNYSNDAKETVDAMIEIKSIIGDSGMVGGPASISAEIRTITNKEIIYYSLVAFVIIFIILFISMDSFIEPILFFVGIGVAIVLNMGTNSFFKDVSYNTHSIASIIQLAVSMDYSIFLLHRYIEEKKENPDKNKAMIIAIKKTLSSILASSLTTVGGFMALTFMNYEIGRDLGLVLSKGVFFSLLTVITLLPILILLFDEKIEKYKHKIYFPNFKIIAPLAVKYGSILLILAILITVPAYLAQNNVDYYYDNEKILPSDSYPIIANVKIDKLFANKNQLALIIPKEDKLKEVQLLDDLKSLEGIKSVRGLYSLVDVTMPNIVLPDAIKDNFLSENYSMINIVLNRPMEGESTNITLDNIKSITNETYSEYYLTGESAILSDLKLVTSKDFNKVTLISIGLIGGIILIAFKSLSIPLILVFIIQLGIWINLAIPYFLGNELNFISFIIIGAIQLGATVDYAILYTSRFRENLELYNEKEAAQKTIEDTGSAILTSALILFTGTLSVSLITSIKNAAELTLLIGRGAIISLILVIGVLPTLLLVFNKIIGLTTINWPKKR